MGETIIVECVASGGLWNTAIDASEFQSAILNLSINARDAMPEGGELTIEVGKCCPRQCMHHPPCRDRAWPICAVHGRAKAWIPSRWRRALDPFFTTKAASKVPGLRFYQVYGFVKQSGGHPKIYSEVGEGTTVKLYLPLQFCPETVHPTHAGALALTGTETVLLVDDDEIVRTTVASMLEDLGYTVLVAQGGAKALALFEKGVKIDLLFTDIVMPGAISGRQLAEQAVAILPTLKILYTSGYTRDAIVHDGHLDPGVELLSKPYGREQLAAKLRRVLDSSTTEPRQTAEL